jgi:hypothetical protein
MNHPQRRSRYKPETPPQASQEAPEQPLDVSSVLPGVKSLGEAPEASPGRKRRARASLAEFRQKLGAPPRPGQTRRWFNDSGNRLAEAAELGYDFVSDTAVKTSSPGSRVSRLVGTKANGEPLHAFLMETPDELYAEGVAEKEELARTVDQAITRGEGTTDGQMSSIPQSEAYGQGSIRPGR